MKLTAFSLAALALGASATVLDDTPTRVERDLPTVTSVIATVQSSLAALDDAVNAFSGSATGLTNAGTALQSAISGGVTTIQASSNLSLNDAVGLQSQVGPLQTIAQKLVTDLAAKKPAIQQANLCDTVRQQSDSINSQSQQLINAITSKVPVEAQSIASSIAGQFVVTLQQNSANFAQGNCTNAGGAAPPPGSTGTSSASSASGSARTTTATSLATGSTARPSMATTGGAATGRPSATGSGGSVPVATAGAVLNAVPLGGLALGFAAFLV